MKIQPKDSVIIRFSGDSGDGVQLIGSELTNTVSFFGNQIASFSDFPAEIRAPQGTLFGVSGFQLHFGDHHIFTPGDKYDVLVALNAAAFKKDIPTSKMMGF